MNYKEIKEIVDDFGNAKIDEISIEFPDGTKVSMKKNTAPVMPKESVQYIVPTPAEKTEVVANKAENAKEEKEDYKVVKSPMVGTFYSKSSPKALSPPVPVAVGSPPWIINPSITR